METKKSARLKTTILFIVVAVPLILNGQNSNPPRNDFNLSFSRDMLELGRGDSGQVDIVIQKSKSYQRRNVKMGVSSTLPNGVAITFDPEDGKFNQTRANISIQSDAPRGEYLLILNATIGHKTKGSIVRLLIS